MFVHFGLQFSLSSFYLHSQKIKKGLPHSTTGFRVNKKYRCLMSLFVLTFSFPYLNSNHNCPSIFSLIWKYAILISSFVNVLSSDLKVILTQTDFLYGPNFASFSKISITLTSSMRPHETSLAMPAISKLSASFTNSIFPLFFISSSSLMNLFLSIKNEISLKTGGKTLTSL